MNEQEILEYNKRCAEFLGWKYSQNYESFNEFDNIWEKETDGVWYKESDRIENPKGYELYYVKVNGFYLKDYNYILKFHSDWNWIMEVCISLGMEFVTSNKEQLIQQIYDKLRSMEANS